MGYASVFHSLAILLDPFEIKKEVENYKCSNSRLRKSRFFLPASYNDN